MNTISILLCDGLGTRWIRNDIKYKHLIPLDNTPIVFRTIKQLKKYETDILLVAPDEFKYLSGFPEVSQTTIGYRYTQKRTLLDGILRTKSFWKERTIILLGDVIFSHKAIDLLFTTKHPEFILGRRGSNPITWKQAKELFAFSFTDFQVESRLRQLLKTPGKLWDYYYAFQPPLIDPEDYTDDIDSPQAYQEFYIKLLQAVRSDK